MRVGHVPVPRRKENNRVGACQKGIPERRRRGPARLQDGQGHRHTPRCRRDGKGQHAQAPAERQRDRHCNLPGRLAPYAEARGRPVREWRGGSSARLARRAAPCAARVVCKAGQQEHFQVCRVGGRRCRHAAVARRRRRRLRRGGAARGPRPAARHSQGRGGRRMAVVHTQPGRPDEAARDDRTHSGQPAVGLVRQAAGARPQGRGEEDGRRVRPVGRRQERKVRHGRPVRRQVYRPVRGAGRGGAVRVGAAARRNGRGRQLGQLCGKDGRQGRRRVGHWQPGVPDKVVCHVLWRARRPQVAAPQERRCKAGRERLVGSSARKDSVGATGRGSSAAPRGAVRVDRGRQGARDAGRHDRPALPRVRGKG